MSDIERRLASIEVMLEELAGRPVPPHAEHHELAGGDTVRLSVQNSGSQLNRQRTLNFGAGLTASESSANKRIDVVLADHDHTGDPGDGGALTLTQYFYVNFIIDGGGAEITTGIKGFVQVPAGTIEAWAILPDQSGSIKIDVWRDTYTNYPPTDADSLCNGHEPELSASTKAQDTDLSDWTSVALVEGDILGYNVDSVDTVERVTLSLKVRR